MMLPLEHEHAKQLVYAADVMLTGVGVGSYVSWDAVDEWGHVIILGLMAASWLLTVIIKVQVLRGRRRRRQRREWN